jgi:hypothetical protein
MLIIILVIICLGERMTGTNMCYRCGNNPLSKKPDLELTEVLMDKVVSTCEVCKTIQVFHVSQMGGGSATQILTSLVGVSQSLPKPLPVLMVNQSQVY